MDYLTRKELNGLKGDIKASQYALEAEKQTFQKKLLSEIGQQMVEELSKTKTEQINTKKKKKCFLLRLFNKKGG